MTVETACMPPESGFSPFPGSLPQKFKAKPYVLCGIDMEDHRQDKNNSMSDFADQQLATVTTSDLHNMSTVSGFSVHRVQIFCRYKPR